jgi:hypothetical protein
MSSFRITCFQIRIWINLHKELKFVQNRQQFASKTIKLKLYNPTFFFLYSVELQCVKVEGIIDFTLKKKSQLFD